MGMHGGHEEFKLLVGNPKGGDLLEGLSVGWKIMLKWFIQKYGM